MLEGGGIRDLKGAGGRAPLPQLSPRHLGGVSGLQRGPEQADGLLERQMVKWAACFTMLLCRL